MFRAWNNLYNKMLHISWVGVNVFSIWLSFTYKTRSNKIRAISTEIENLSNFGQRIKLLGFKEKKWQWSEFFQSGWLENKFVANSKNLNQSFSNNFLPHTLLTLFNKSNQEYLEKLYSFFTKRHKNKANDCKAEWPSDIKVQFRRACGIRRCCRLRFLRVHLDHLHFRRFQGRILVGKG